jgi:hypothetical protein
LEEDDGTTRRRRARRECVDKGDGEVVVLW